MTEWWKRHSHIAVKDPMEAEIVSPTNDIQSPTDDKAESCSEDTPSSDDKVEDSNQIQLYTKAEVEDFTGCIPLLLDNLQVR
jgi:hypothetical protein